MTRDDWRAEFTKWLVQSTFVMMEDTVKKSKGTPINLAEIQVNFLATYIGSLLYVALTEEPNKSVLKRADREEFTIDNFAYMKTKIQEAVAAAFTSAMRAHAGKEIDYYCQVKAVPPVANKEPC